MFKSDEIALLKLGCNLPKLSSSQIALPKIILPTAESRRFTFAKQSTGSTFNYGDFTNNNAFFWSSLDLSPLAGTDLGSTPFYIELVDNAGKKATGYLAGVGAGETLSPLVDGDTLNGNMETGDPPTGWNGVGTPTLDGVADERTGGTGIQSLSITRGTESYSVARNLTLVLGGLYKLGSWINVSTSTSTQIRVVRSSDYASQFQTVASAPAVWINSSIYGTCIYVNSTIVLVCGTVPGVEARYDDVYLGRVTDPPSTACHIVSSLNGTTRAWQIKETGFNPNTITSWVIYAV